MAGLLSFLSNITGDLANIAAPPAYLAPLSVTEVPSSWGQRPALFAAAAKEPDAAKRALCVLKFILAALRSQYYNTGDTKSGIKKPLNAFLGELFIACWSDDDASTEMVVEQVSHHPPVSAVYLRDEAHGVHCQAYTRPIMTFNGNIVIDMSGHAVLHLDKYNEDYLFTFAHTKIQGFLSGHLYPELDGSLRIVSSSGYISEVKFSGQGYFYGLRNSFEAKVVHKDDPTRTPMFTVSGQWCDEFTIIDEESGEALETFDSATEPLASITIPDIEDQDPWESRRAWAGVIGALKTGDLTAAAKEKTRLEEAQRAMRREDNGAKDWEPKFFVSLAAEDEVFTRLAPLADLHVDPKKTKGIWRWKGNKNDRLPPKPFYTDMTPYGKIDSGRLTSSK